MKEDIIEYHPNGRKSHIIVYYPNGNKQYERFFDQQGCDHRDEDLPDYQAWNENGRIFYISYYVHGCKHNIGNPNSIRFNDNGKVWFKKYRINDQNYSKLTWMNLIKNI